MSISTPADTSDRPHAAAAEPRAPKGRQTRATILEAALALAAQIGIEGLSIGVVADAIGMSKSGVFAHFGSREELQISVVRAYHARFEEDVFTPALRAPRGLPRLTELFERWVRRVSVEADFGCIYISGAVELDDRPGAVRDALVGMVQTWQGALERAILAAVAEGHLRADTDAQQMLFELHGMVLALHHDARLLRHSGADERARAAYRRLIADHQPRRAGRARAAAPASAAVTAKPARPAAGRGVAKSRVTRRDPV